MRLAVEDGLDLAAMWVGHLFLRKSYLVPCAEQHEMMRRRHGISLCGGPGSAVHRQIAALRPGRRKI
jgi:hypothetical protein